MKQLDYGRRIKGGDEFRESSGVVGGLEAFRNEDHIADTHAAGKGLCDPEVVAMVVREAPTRINELIAWGTHFDQVNGQVARKPSDAVRAEDQVSLFEGRERAMAHKLVKKAKTLADSHEKGEVANLIQDDMAAYSDAYAERLIIERSNANVAGTANSK